MRSPVAWLKDKSRKRHVARYEKRVRRTPRTTMPNGTAFDTSKVRPVTRPKRQPSVAEVRKKKRRAAAKRAKASRKRNRV